MSLFDSWQAKRALSDTRGNKVTKNSMKSFYRLIVNEQLMRFLLHFLFRQHPNKYIHHDVWLYEDFIPFHMESLIFLPLLKCCFRCVSPFCRADLQATAAQLHPEPLCPHTISRLPHLQIIKFKQTGMTALSTYYVKYHAVSSHYNL